MEERGLGTKATRHDIIQKLYNRGYIQGNPIEPSETGIAMVKAFERFAERIATPDMTAELEQDMDRIAEGEVTKDEVVRISREMLHEAYNSMDQNKEELAKTIWEGMDQDRILGPCWKCKEEGRAKEDGSPNKLRIIRARKSGKRFVGCEGYPDCDQTYGIPQRGDLIRLEEVCSICGKTPRLKVLSGRRPWNLCLNEECPSMEEMRRRAGGARGREGGEGGGCGGRRRGRRRSADGRRQVKRQATRAQAQDQDGRRSPRPVLITFEGIDRSGKTTQARLLAEALGEKALLVREPGGTPAAERIRELVKDPTLELSPIAETLLFGAARAELVATVIRPALAEGKIVICDRYIDSTVAYQGGARGLGIEKVEELNHWITDGLEADLTFLLDILPEPGEPRGRASPTASRTRGRRCSTRSPSPTRSWPCATATATCASTPARPVEDVHREVLSHMRERLTALR